MIPVPGIISKEDSGILRLESCPAVYVHSLDAFIYVSHRTFTICISLIYVRRYLSYYRSKKFTSKMLIGDIRYGRSVDEV
jgi:hypothetical protein